MKHFADRLADAVRAKKNSLCVGLDPQMQSLPILLIPKHFDGTLDGIAKAYEEFCRRVIDIVAPLVPIVKPQAAFFEACGPAGFAALQRILQYARSKELITILDGKRNDIASTAAAYADAAFGGTTLGTKSHPVWDADAITVNAYLGRDSIEPFLTSARRDGRGVFILVRTSNPGAGQFQDLECKGRPLYMHVAEAVGSWAAENRGKSGYGDVGAVVGATHPQELRSVREALPDVWFLIPGYGAQGAGASDVAPGFREDGLGAIVNSSRGILYRAPPHDSAWEGEIERATLRTIKDLVSGTPMGALQSAT